MLRLVLALALFAAPARDGVTVSGKVTVSKNAKKRVVVLKYTGPGLELHKEPASSPAVVWLKGAKGSVEPKTIEIQQQGLEFRPRVAAVTAGSTVKFPNGDDLFHNVFSLGGNDNDFDLGKYKKGQTKDSTFEVAGRVDVRCKVHEHMRAFILVFKHPYFSVCGEDGSYSIPRVPPGKYTLVVWKEDYDEVRREIEVTADGAKIDLEIAAFDERPAGRDLNAGCCAAR